MFGLCYDVTGRVNLENELRSRARQQEALAQLGERALADPGLDRLLNDAVSTVALTLSVDFVKILELLPGGIELLLRAGFRWKSDLVGTILTTTAAGSFARHTSDSAIPVVIDEFSGETRFEIPQYLVDHGCTSGMNVTIARPRWPCLWHSWRVHRAKDGNSNPGNRVPESRWAIFLLARSNAASSSSATN